MKHILTLFILALFLSACINTNISPQKLEGKWALKSLNFILDCKTYTVSKKAPDATGWINVKLEFAPNEVQPSRTEQTQYVFERR